MREIFDVELVDRLFDECEKIINAEDQVEFWFFHGEHAPRHAFVSQHD